MALAVPILDASIAVFRRLVRGDGVFEADGDHIHHRLIGMGLTPRRVVAILYAVAAGFGALSLLTMTSRGQIVGIVVIASSVVTWIGVQQLGYAEFAEIQRSLRHGLSNERRSVGNNVYLASLTQQLLRAEDRERLWSKLVEAAARLQFDRVELWRGDIHGLVAPAGPPLETWVQPHAPLPPGPCSVWTVPAVGHGEVFATLYLTRSLSSPSQFDPTYLLNALQEGFAPRLHALLDRSPQATSHATLEPSAPTA
jgi:hypothetical protein